MKKCQNCKSEEPTTKVKVQIDLRHDTAVDLTMTIPLCDKCDNLVKTDGIDKMPNVRWVSAV